MTSEGLGEVFKGDSADTCGGKFPQVSMGGRANGQACADGERGPPSARAEIFTIMKSVHCCNIYKESYDEIWNNPNLIQTDLNFALLETIKIYIIQKV